MILPNLNVTYTLPQQLLDEARAFFQECGRECCEGTALLVGQPDADRVRLSRLFIPEQRCIKTPLGNGHWGLRVELTQQAHYKLTNHLLPGQLFYARIHSHPGKAFHSDTDNSNGVISHQGAISIVVPYFAADPIELQRCAIFRLEHGRGWLLLEQAEVARLFEVLHD